MTFSCADAPGTLGVSGVVPVQPTARLETQVTETLDESPAPQAAPIPLPGMVAWNHQPRAVLPAPVVEAPLACALHAERFPADETSTERVRAVRVTVELTRPFSGGTWVEFVSPGGIVYEQRPVSFAGGALQAELELPVAGTLVDVNQMAGTWSARCVLGGESFPATSFELSP